MPALTDVPCFRKWQWLPWVLIVLEACISRFSCTSLFVYISCLGSLDRETRQHWTRREGRSSGSSTKREKRSIIVVHCLGIGSTSWGLGRFWGDKTVPRFDIFLRHPSQRSAAVAHYYYFSSSALFLLAWNPSLTDSLRDIVVSGRCEVGRPLAAVLTLTVELMDPRPQPSTPLHARLPRSLLESSLSTVGNSWLEGRTGPSSVRP